PDAGRQRVGFGPRRRRHRQAEPAEVVVLVVVTVPAAVVLRDVERQHRAGEVADRMFGGEDRLSRLVASAGAGVGPPGSVVVTVDRERYRAGDTLLLAAVVVDRLQRRFGRVEVGRRLVQLYLLVLVCFV